MESFLNKLKRLAEEDNKRFLQLTQSESDRVDALTGTRNNRNDFTNISLSLQITKLRVEIAKMLKFLNCIASYFVGLCLFYFLSRIYGYVQYLRHRDDYFTDEHLKYAASIHYM